jgi:hypothetical protein
MGLLCNFRIIASHIGRIQMRLGIHALTGLVYEGAINPDMPVLPMPTITQAKLIETEDDWQKLPSGLYQSPTSWVFREDSFDAVSRTRRGRLYASAVTQQQPSRQAVSPHPYENPYGQVYADGRPTKELLTYDACTQLVVRPDRGLGCTLALGITQAASTWRIVQAEITATGCVMITMKALSVYGIIPKIDLSKIKAQFQQAVTEAIERVLNSAFRDAPISVVDNCRDAMCVLMSRWLVQQGHDDSILSKDLGDVSNVLLKPEYAKNGISNLAKTIGLLHSRGKTNEKHARDLRAPVEGDAELAIQSLGFAIRDIGWAKQE